MEGPDNENNNDQKVAELLAALPVFFLLPLQHLYTSGHANCFQCQASQRVVYVTDGQFAVRVNELFFIR